MSIFFLGPAGTFSEKAARAYAGAAEGVGGLVPCDNIRVTAESILAGGGPDVAVLPYYNLYDGAVVDTIDALLRHGLHVHRLVRLGITFDAGIAGSAEDVSVVSSHPKALAQCTGFIRERFPEARLEPAASTAAAVALAQETEGMLALASPDAIGGSPLVTIAQDVSDRKYGVSNYTEFLAVSTKPVDDSDSSGVILRLAATEDAGTIADLARLCGEQGARIMKVISRPSPPDPALERLAPHTLVVELAIQPGSRFDFIESAGGNVLGFFSVDKQGC